MGIIQIVILNVLLEIAMTHEFNGVVVPSMKALFQAM
jgi:hypothetical protein